MGNLFVLAGDKVKASDARCQRQVRKGDSKTQNIPPRIFFFAFPFHNVNDEPLIFGVENADSVPTTADGNKYRPVHSKSRFHLLRLRWRLNVISQNGSSSLSVFYAFLNKCEKDIT